MNRANDIQYPKTPIVRVIVAACLFFLIWRGVNHLLPFQLLAPPIYHVGYDFTYWLFMWLRLDQWLVISQPGSFIFTAAIFLSLVLLFAFPKNRVIAVLAAVIFFLYCTAFNIFLGHSLHYQVGFVILFFTFCSGRRQFDLWWQTARYFACFAFFTAFAWKMVYGGIFQWDGGELSAKQNLAAYLYHYPDTAMAHFYYWVFQHPFWINLGHKVVILAEGVFLVGFFTKKLDRLLLWLLCFIVISIYLFADVFFFELLILTLPFVRPAGWHKLQGWFGYR